MKDSVLLPAKVIEQKRDKKKQHRSDGDFALCASPTCCLPASAFVFSADVLDKKP